MISPLRPSRISIAACSILALCLTGCGGDPRGIVTGNVTLDGKPLADATVMFILEDDNAVLALGITDASGKYTLEEDAEVFSTPPGTYIVRISTYQPARADDDPPFPGAKERVPARYNIDSELKQDVAEGENPCDFPLESGGRIFQPPDELF